MRLQDDKLVAQIVKWNQLGQKMRQTKPSEMKDLE
jgi:hypothetical protein